MGLIQNDTYKPYKTKGKKPIARTKIDRYQNAMLKKVMSITKPELKTYRNQVTGSVSDAGYLLDLTNVITQGTASSNRIGDKIKVMAIEVRGYLKRADTTNVVRLMLCRNKAESLTPTDFPNAIGFADPTKIYAYKDNLRSLDVYHEFSNILYKQRYTNGIRVEFQTSQIHNQLLFYVVTDSDAAPHPSIEFAYVIDFIDV